MTLVIENLGENRRQIKGARQDVFLNREDPWGFWYINFERTKTPDELSGAFTSIDQAFGAFELYITKNPEKVTVKDTTGNAASK